MPALSTPTEPAICKVIQDAVTPYLASITELAALTIIGRREKTIANDIEAAVAQLGACIFVFPTVPVTVSVNVDGPYLDVLEQRVRCIENPALNSSAPDVFEQVEFVLRALHGKQFVIEGVSGLNPFFARSNPVETVDDNERLIRDVIFHSSAGLKPRDVQ